MPLRRHAQALAQRTLGPAHPAALKRWRRLQAAARARRVGRLTRDFVAWHGLTVSGGPFAGLSYPDATATSLVPKLLGAYERVLHAAVEEAVRAAPELIVNVGAADGYYAVGLARRCPGATVRAFEADAGQRALLTRVAAANATRLEVGGLAGPGDLEALPPGTLVVMDCEGCERALLQPETLRDAAILVELHDFVEPGVSDVIVERFRATHHVTLIETASQPPERGSALGLALSEHRPGPMRWAVLRPA